MTRTDLQIKFHKETGKQVLQTGIEINMYFTDDYIAWLENLALDKANGLERSSDKCHIQSVTISLPSSTETLEKMKKVARYYRLKGLKLDENSFLSGVDFIRSSINERQ